jgi:putative endonuclease
MWKIYILLCDNDYFYIGITSDLSHRLMQHQNKLTKSTSRFTNFKLVFQESFDNKHDAAIREKQLKGWSRQKKQKLIQSRPNLNT